MEKTSCGMDMESVRRHLFDRDYMSGIERDEARIKANAEVFTPDSMVKKLVGRVIEADDSAFENPEKRILDPACGDGQFLARALWERLKRGMAFEAALSTIYGIEIMEDNAELCRVRLLCGREDLRPVAERNIVQADALTYHMRFDGSDPNLSNRELRDRDQMKGIFG